MKIKYIIGLLMLCSFVACIDEGGNAIEGAGANFVRIPAGSKEINIAGLDAVAGNVKYSLMEVLRDANSSASLSAPSDVKLKLDNSLITAYNTAHNTTLIPLEGGYTLESLDLKFGSGEFSKKVYLNLDPSKLDLSKKYALGIAFESATGGFTPVPSLSKALFNVVIKNQWDGRYQAIGVFHHPTAGDRDINEIKDLITTGARSVEGNLGDLGGSGYRMNLVINADNTVTIQPKGATPNIDQSYGPNVYDPVTKSFKLHYSYNVAAPRIIEETITLK
jgi:hypothetical protein